MAGNKKNDYFDLITKQTAYCVEAGRLLEDMICQFHSENAITSFNRIHDVEHNADTLHHDILTRLSTEFITPIDHEDILRLVQIIDDVTDAIDEVALDFYMYNLSALPPRGEEMAKLVNRCVGALYDAVGELKNFKKPDKLRLGIVAVNDIEGCADGVYTEAIHELFSIERDTRTLIGCKAVLESLENCCDLCEHASDVMEQIIIKNT